MVDKANWRFERVFNVGTIIANVISGLLVLAGLVGVYVDLRQILVMHEERLQHIEAEIALRRPLIDAFIQSQPRLQAVEQAIIDFHHIDDERTKQLSSIAADLAVIRAIQEQNIDKHRGTQ